MEGARLWNIDWFVDGIHNFLKLNFKIFSSINTTNSNKKSIQRNFRAQHQPWIIFPNICLIFALNLPDIMHTFHHKPLPLERELCLPFSTILNPILLWYFYLHYFLFFLLLLFLFVILQNFHQLPIVVVWFLVFLRQIIYFVFFCAVSHTHSDCLPFRTYFKPLITFYVSLAIASIVNHYLFHFFILFNCLLVPQPFTISWFQNDPWRFSWVLQFLFQKHFFYRKFVFF